MVGLWLWLMGEGKLQAHKFEDNHVVFRLWLADNIQQIHFSCIQTDVYCTKIVTAKSIIQLSLKPKTYLIFSLSRSPRVKIILCLFKSEMFNSV